MNRESANPLTLAFLTLLMSGACMSTEDYREEADSEVYDIIDSRRGALGLIDDFQIGAPTDSLRTRILAGGEREVQLTLIECLAVAAEDSREYQARRESLYRVALELTRRRWDFSYQETSSGLASADGTLLDAGTASGSAGAGISKLFSSGARLLSDVSLDLVRNIGTGDGWSLFSNFSFSLTQPLLRGYGKDIVLEPLKQAERDVMYEARSFERFRRTFAFDVASRFYRIVQQRDTLFNEESNYESLIRIRLRNQAFAEAGRLSDIQVDQALQDELRAQDRVVESRRSLETSLDDFALFLGLPIETKIELIESEETAFGIADLLESDLAEELAISLALTERLDYLTVVDRVVDTERRVLVAENALLGAFDVSAGFDGRSNDDEPGSYSRSDVNWELSAALDLPIDQIPERNAYRLSTLDYAAAKRDHDQLHDGIFADIRAELRELAARRESYEIQTGAVKLARRRVESSSLNQEAGRADTRDLLEAQAALIQAENEATRAFTDYTLAGLALFRDMGLLRVVDAGVTVASELVSDVSRP